MNRNKDCKPIHDAQCHYDSFPYDYNNDRYFSIDSNHASSKDSWKIYIIIFKASGNTLKEIDTVQKTSHRHTRIQTYIHSNIFTIIAVMK